MDYVEVLRRRWWVPVIFGLVGLLVAALVAPSSSHRASGLWKTKALVGIVPSQRSLLALGAGEVLFYAHKASVISEAATSVGIHEPLSTLVSDVSSSTGSTGKDGQSLPSGVVQLSTIASSPELSAAFTNAFAAQLGAYVNGLQSSAQAAQVEVLKAKVAELESAIASLGVKAPPSLRSELNTDLGQEQALEIPSSTGYDVLQPAEASTAARAGGASASSTKRVVYVAGGLLAGLAVGALLVLAIAFFDKRLHSRSGAEEAFGYRVVSQIPKVEPGADAPPLSDAAADAFQKLFMAVLMERVGAAAVVTDWREAGVEGRHASGTSAQLVAPKGVAGRKVILVVSPGSEPTRTMVVDNLAATCAEAGQRTVVANTQGLHSEPSGAREVGHTGEMTPAVLKSYLQRSKLENVALLPLGQLVGNSGQLLMKAPTVLSALRQLCDLVVIEAPPLLAFHDGEVLASLADVVVIIGELDFTTSEQAQRAGDILRRIDAPVVGVALTAVPVSKKDLQRSHLERATRRSQLEPDSGSLEAVGAAPAAQATAPRQ